MNLLILCLLVIELSSCTTVSDLKSISSGYMGCPRSQIEISDNQGGGVGTFASPMTWTATCNGKVFYCSKDSSSPYSETVSCKEAQKT